MLSGDKEPLGVVVMEGCTVELAEIVDTNAFCILFRAGSGVSLSSGRTYTLAADTQHEMEAWMRACACANYEYLRLTVADLQRQLDELNSSPHSSTSSSNTNNIHNNVSRFNPFDGMGRQTAPVKIMRTFSDLHVQFGAKIKRSIQS